MVNQHPIPDSSNYMFFPNKISNFLQGGPRKTNGKWGYKPYKWPKWVTVVITLLCSMYIGLSPLPVTVANEGL